MPHFDILQICNCGKQHEKRRNCLLTSNFTFAHDVSTQYGTFFHFKRTLEMSSAVCFNLDQSKILSSGNGLSFVYVQFNCGWSAEGPE